MPMLWNETIDAHRRAVRDATLDAAAALVAKNGLLSVTMSGIAEETGISRATLYKYFPDVEAILVAWHERQVATHFEQLVAIRDGSGGAAERLEAVLQAYASISNEHHQTGFVARLHRGEQVALAQRQLSQLVRDLLAEGQRAGEVRDDIEADELAAFCLHAVTAAGTLPSRAAVSRLVTVIMAGLRPPC
jgi:AcrR family transcriptional regulator